MNYCSGISVKSRQTDRRTESDAYEPTVQYAQVGSKMQLDVDVSPPATFVHHCAGNYILTERNTLEV